MPGYRGRSFRAWLFSIAHNTVIDLWRRQRPERPLDDAFHTPDTGPSPEEFALAGEARHTLRTYLVQLSPDQRTVVELRLAGLTGAEIAAVLGRSEGAVKLLHFRAINRLRALFGVQITDQAEEARDATPVQQPGC